jgi:hypothetical protein
MLALIKPTALRTFSTLDPLVRDHIDEEVPEETLSISRRPPPNFLTRAARLLKGNLTRSDSVDMTETGTVLEARGEGNGGAVSPARSEASDLVSTAAATLIDGALPVRDFPDNLLSEPASMAPSANSSFHEDDMESEEFRKRRSSSLLTSHREELRCVIAIIRRKSANCLSNVSLLPFTNVHCFVFYRFRYGRR